MRMSLDAKPDNDTPEAAGSCESACYTADDIQAAYFEGFADGVDHGNLEWKYPPYEKAWEQSETQRKCASATQQQDAAPVGWTIVSIGKDGSLLCDSANGRRCRWWLNESV